MFLHDPRSIRNFKKWIISDKRAHSPITDMIPWINFDSYSWLMKNIKKTMTIFEFGSGGSTLFFAKNMRKLVSVEHDAKWFGAVSKKINDFGLTNCDYKLVEPKKLGRKANSQNSLYISNDYEGYHFLDYVKTIEKYENQSFDVVFIDGQVRNACIQHSIPKVRKGGILILDNSERQIYGEGVRMLSKFKKLNFFGPGAYNNYFWQTTIWKID